MRSYILLSTLAAANILASARPVDSSSALAARKEGGIVDLDGHAGRPDLEMPNLHGNTGYPEDAEMPHLKGETGRPKESKPLPRKDTDNLAKRADKSPNAGPAGKALKDNKLPSDARKGTEGLRSDNKDPARLGGDAARQGGGSTPEVDKALKENDLSKTGDRGFDTADKGSKTTGKGVDRAEKGVTNTLNNGEKALQSDEKAAKGLEKLPMVKRQRPTAEDYVKAHEWPARSPHDGVIHADKPEESAMREEDEEEAMREEDEEESAPRQADSTDVDDYLKKYDLPKTTDEAFHRGEDYDKRSIKADPISKDDTTLPQTARQGVANGGTYSPPGLKTALKEHSLPATTEEAFGKRAGGGIPVIGGLMGRLGGGGTGLGRRDDLDSSELAKRQLPGGLKEFFGSLGISGGPKIGTKRDTSGIFKGEGVF